MRQSRPPAGVLAGFERSNKVCFYTVSSVFGGPARVFDTQLGFRVFPKPLPASAKPSKPNPFGWTPTRTDTKTHPHKSGDRPRNHKKLSSAPHRVAFHHPERPQRGQQCDRWKARSGGLPVGPFSGGPLTPAA